MGSVDVAVGAAGVLGGSAVGSAIGPVGAVPLFQQLPAVDIRGRERTILSLKDVQDLVPLFDPEQIRVERWVKKIETLREIYGWPENTTMCFAVHRLGVVPKLWYESIENEHFGWNEFKQGVLKAFQAKVN